MIQISALTSDVGKSFPQHCILRLTEVSCKGARMLQSPFLFSASYVALEDLKLKLTHLVTQTKTEQLLGGRKSTLKAH